MDEQTMRDLLAQAVAAEPPAGPIAQGALGAGMRLRRRRRIQGSAACVASIAVIAAAVPLLTGASGRHTTPVQH